MIEKANSAGSVTSVSRVFGILEALASSQEIGLSELSKKLYMSKSTIFRFLQTMKELGYVAQDPDTERYSLTMKLFQISSIALNLHDLNRVANKYMAKLAHRTHETVHLAILDEQSKAILYIHKVDAEYNLSLTSRIGKKAPIHCTALGKIMMGFSPFDTVRDMLEGLEYRKYTPRTISNEKDFLKELEVVKRQGYAEDLGEHEENVRCVATPIRDRFGNTIAGLSITWPEFRFNIHELPVYVEWLRSTADSISHDLGFFDTLASN